MQKLSSTNIEHLQTLKPLNAWFLAARPKTLPVSIAPILMGTLLAKEYVPSLQWTLAFWALLFSLWVQIGTNLINDALDFKKGADPVDRLGPARMTAKGKLNFKQVLKGGFLCLALALLCGIPLLLAGGWPLLIILLICVSLAYLYTGGPFPLAYYGLSDLFVLIFFGWVSTCTVFYLQTGYVTLPCFVAATQIGLLAVVPNAINNLRDHVTDARVNKRTLAVRLGPVFARYEICLLSFIPFALGLFWILLGKFWMAGLPFLALPFVFSNMQAIWTTAPSFAYNQYLAVSARCHFLFGLLLALGSVL